MNRTLATVAVVLALTPSAGGADDVTNDTVCDMIGQTAGMMMDLRQRGVSLSQGLGLSTHEIVRRIVLDAWGYPAMRTAVEQERMIAEFRDAWHLHCLRVGWEAL
jgi:hypothetical protein